MRIVPRDEILAEKLKRRSEINAIESDLNGDLIHSGKVSTGCSTCFFRSNNTKFEIYIGAKCNVECGECYYPKDRTDDSFGMVEKMARNFADLYQTILDPYFDLKNVSYNSFGEPLMYMPAVMEAGKLILNYQKTRGKKVFSHMYTNGILATREVLEQLKSIELTEIRFHLSASNWSNKVKEHMIIAKELGFRVTVEESSLPEKREKIFEHLPWFDEIGLDHLDLVECQVTADNFEYLDKKYPEGRYYQDRIWHLYDEGMVYDVIEEKIKKGYSFSIIDCNSRNEVARDGQYLDMPRQDIRTYEQNAHAFKEFNQITGE